MILEASRAGVDCVKFQKSCLEAKFTRSALNRPYRSPNSFGSTYGEHKRFLEFTIEQFKELKDYAESCGLVFSASAMDIVCKFSFYINFILCCTVLELDDFIVFLLRH
jgi:sialic acid synthase